ncbi:MAG: hypothetical protein ACTSVO_04210 [Candidatus Heimdallarchaeaceae archaeon]
MCSRAIVLYKITKVVIVENTTYIGDEEYLRLNHVELINYRNNEYMKLITDFIDKNPILWNVFIGN